MPGLEEYSEIPRVMLERINGNAWSVESRQPEEENQTLLYLGSTRKGDIVRDYYTDGSQYWYRNRAVVGDRIVSMEVYIFGKEARDLKRKRD